MTTKKMLGFLDFLHKNNIFVFNFQQLCLYFSEYTEEELQKCLDRFLKMTLIKHLYKDLYMDPRSRHLGAYPLEQLIKYLRPLKFSYISQEQILSEYGIISQVATLVTCMTTGETEFIVTPIGAISFSHFDPPEDINSFMEEIVWDEDKCMYEATPYRAWLDLKATRSAHMCRLVDREELEEATQGRIPNIDDIDPNLYHKPVFSEKLTFANNPTN